MNKNWTLLIDDKEANLPLDFNFEIRKQCTDIRELEYRKGDEIKSFTLPFTNLNAIALNHPYDADSDNAIDIVTTATALLTNGVTEIKGTLKVKSLSKQGYECELLSGTLDWMTLLDGKKLNDLDISEMDRTFNIATILAGWNVGAPV